jgi:hypothetical protein
VSHHSPRSSTCGTIVADNEPHSWLVYKIIDLLRHLSIQQPTVVAAGVITASMVIVSVLSAFPWVRK